MGGARNTRRNEPGSCNELKEGPDPHSLSSRFPGVASATARTLRPRPPSSARLLPTLHSTAKRVRDRRTCPPSSLEHYFHLHCLSIPNRLLNLSLNATAVVGFTHSSLSLSLSLHPPNRPQVHARRSRLLSSPLRLRLGSEPGPIGKRWICGGRTSPINGSVTLRFGIISSAVHPSIHPSIHPPRIRLSSSAFCLVLGRLCRASVRSGLAWTNKIARLG